MSEFEFDSIVAAVREALEWTQEVKASAEPFLATEEAQQTLAREMATPEGQKLYTDVQHAFSGSFDAIDQSAAKASAVFSSAAFQQETTEVRTQATQAQAACGEIRERVQPYTTTASMASTRTSASAKSATPTQTASSSTASAGSGTGMVDYVQNAQTRLTGDNVTPADHMVMSELAYITKVIPNSSVRYQHQPGQPTKTVGQYAEELLAAQKASGTEPKDPNAIAFLESLAQSPRYKDLPLDSVHTQHDGQVDTNIVCVNLGNGKGMIGVQGTNGTVQDWINDAKFSSVDPTQEEKYITESIEWLIAENGYDGVYLSGHSQGGRDAVTAAAMCDDETRAKLIEIYNLDGPGYRQEMLDKYKDEFAAIEDRVHNFYPSGSYVGQIYNPVGDCTYTESQGDTFDPYLHSQYNWIIDPETGGAVAPDTTTSKYIVGKIINAVVDYAGSKLSPEQTEQAASIILRLAHDDEDFTKLEFENITKHLDELSAGDIAVLANAGLTVVLSGISDIADVVADVAGVVETAANLVYNITKLIPGAQKVAAVAKAIAEIAKTVKTVAKVIKTVCDFAVKVLKWIAEQREKRLRAAREAYKANNPHMFFEATTLHSAAEHLREANKWILQADKDADGMRSWGAFSVEKEGDDGILSWVSCAWQTAKTVFTGLFRAIDDLIYLRNQPHLLKGARACDTVSQEGKKLLSAIPYTSADEQFEVTPSSLGAQADGGSDAVKKAQKQMSNAKDSITKLGNNWKGEDYDNLKTGADKNIQTLEDGIKSLENGFALMKQIAEAYDKFQDRSIQEFQAAAN